MTAPGLAVLRLTLAFVFIIHGAHILFGVWGGPGPGPGGLDVTAARFDAAGLSPGFVMAALAGLIQLTGGLLLIAGWLTRYAASALILYLVLTAWKIHRPWGFFLNWTGDSSRGQGIEYTVVLIAALACLMFAGSGDWSIDGQRATHAASRAAGRARAMRRG